MKGQIRMTAKEKILAQLVIDGTKRLYEACRVVESNKNVRITVSLDLGRYDDPSCDEWCAEFCERACVYVMRRGQHLAVPLAFSFGMMFAEILEYAEHASLAVDGEPIGDYVPVRCRPHVAV